MRHPKIRAYSAEFLAAQVAGSCRMEGIRVSKSDETLMRDIIAGRVDTVALRASIVAEYKQLNKAC